MTIEFDDKGKFFSDVITKNPVPVMIQTLTHCIHGNIHVRQDQRLKDELDLQEKYIAITDATIYSLDGQVLYQSKFLAVRCDQIVWVMPDSDVTKSAKGSKK